jgi:ATP-dependent RNA helicase MSS116, mitochondrial
MVRRGRGSDRRYAPRRDNNHGQSSRNAEASNKPPSDPVPSGVATPPLTEPVPQDTPRFADLADGNLVHPALVQAITEDMKFDHMMPVQAATLPELLPPKRSDCLVQARTGTGKTVAFLLPAIQTMISRKRVPGAGISILVIAPTRELAMQIAKEADSLLQRLPRYKVCIAIGGTNKDKEERNIIDGCDILIATPGRLFDHMSNPTIKQAFYQLDTLVLDEADRLLDMGFMNALKDIVRCLPDKEETNRQGMLFSATIAQHVEQVALLVLSKGYKFISTIPPGEANTHERVPQHLIKVPAFSLVAPAMVGAIYKEISTIGSDNFKVIVFSPTAALADFYGHILSNISGLPEVYTLHSRMTQNRRTKITNDYREANTGMLVATDVVARGMDFPGVTTVFQIGIPGDKESYIHRLGRTARAGAEGRSIFIITEIEDFFARWTLKEIAFITQEADVSSAPQVKGIAEVMDDEQRAKIYQAWLGYYKNHMKSFKWEKEELVAQANLFARDALCAPETPSIQRSTVGKMGLRGTKGLVIVPDAPRQRHGRGQAPAIDGGGRNGGKEGRARRGGRGNGKG